MSNGLIIILIIVVWLFVLAPLLSDIEGTFIEKMGMWQEKKNFGETYYGVARSTFVVNEDGVVERVYHKVKPVEHAQDVLRDIT